MSNHVNWVLNREHVQAQ